MSRKRDTNWSRDEITVLLDSISEMTKTSSTNGKRTNSKEVFEFAAKKMGEKGYPARAEREKCRTKWKKMKEEFAQAKKAREGDSRYKEAPGIQPFYERMEEFVTGNFDNISPHSTIVRRTSTMPPRSQTGGLRTSARIAVTTNGTTSTDNSDSSSTIVTRTTASSDNNNSFTSSSATINTTSHMPNNQPHQVSSTKENGVVNGSQRQRHLQHQSSQATSTGEINISNMIYTTTCNSTNNSSNSTANTELISSGNNDQLSIHSAEHADISYRVGNGCRQITIFGDHDVDIKFRGDCVTINKISVDFQAND